MIGGGPRLDNASLMHAASFSFAHLFPRARGSARALVAPKRTYSGVARLHPGASHPSQDLADDGLPKSRRREMAIRTLAPAHSRWSSSPRRRTLNPGVSPGDEGWKCVNDRLGRPQRNAVRNCAVLTASPAKPLPICDSARAHIRTWRRPFICWRRVVEHSPRPRTAPRACGRSRHRLATRSEWTMASSVSSVLMLA